METIKKMFKAGDDRVKMAAHIRELHRRWSPNSTEGTDLVEDSLWDRIDLYMDNYTKDAKKTEVREVSVELRAAE